jgi:hypothetical protein
MQFLYQLAGTLASIAWSFALTLVILLIMDRMPYLNLRLDIDEEAMGVDKAQMGASAYDYIEAAVRVESSSSVDTRVLPTESNLAESGLFRTDSEMQLVDMTSSKQSKSQKG